MLLEPQFVLLHLKLWLVHLTQVTPGALPVPLQPLISVIDHPTPDVDICLRCDQDLAVPALYKVASPFHLLHPGPWHHAKQHFQ